MLLYEFSYGTALTVRQRSCVSALLRSGSAYLIEHLSNSDRGLVFLTGF